RTGPSRRAAHGAQPAGTALGVGSPQTVELLFGLGIAQVDDVVLSQQHRRQGLSILLVERGLSDVAGVERLEGRLARGAGGEAFVVRQHGAAEDVVGTGAREGESPELARRAAVDAIGHSLKVRPTVVEVVVGDQPWFV